jgi:hypothetical protein
MAGREREVEWLDQILADLWLLEQALSNELKESLRPDSLLSMIAQDYPRRFGSRTRQLREQHDDIDGAISSPRPRTTSSARRSSRS